MTALLVVAGAVVGAPLRLFVHRLVTRHGRDASLATLAVNVAGSALLGVVLGLTSVPPAVVALVGTGLCGTLTTFSTFGADVVRLIEVRLVWRALGYAVATLVLGVGAGAAGYLLAGAV